MMANAILYTRPCGCTCQSRADGADEWIALCPWVKTMLQKAESWSENNLLHISEHQAEILSRGVDAFAHHIDWTQYIAWREKQEITV